MADTEVDEADGRSGARQAVATGSVFAERYAVEELLGRGGMGSVYRVRDHEVGEIVALKLLDALSATPETVERFRREVRLARRVTHRNAARTYDLGEHEGWRFLTMEYVEGESLHTYLGHSRPSLRRALDITRQLAEGLAAAHAAGVVHRDLKPANVLIESGGRVVITDFGIARAFQDVDTSIQTGGLLGTPAYMSPEQIAGERIDARTDIYSLALILYEMLSGTLPFASSTPMATALARLHRELPDLAAEPLLPKIAAPLLTRCLARQPSDRPGTAREVADTVAGLLELAQTDGHPTTEQPSPLRGALTTAATQHSQHSLAWTTPATPTVPRGRALAVLPFRFRGPRDQAYIAEGLGDELIDVLSTMRGLRVSGSGATARFGEGNDRDPRSVGTELGVDVLVDGTMQLSGSRVRISARLLDVQSGFQLWSERYDGTLEDVFALQDTMGKRIAEALRLELEDIAHRGGAPAEAIEAYLRARRLARTWDWKGPEGAVALYDRCIELAPEFKPALAGRAIAYLRAWFLPSWDADEPDWEKLAAEVVAEALEGAPELAETHLAAAIHGVQRGEYKQAATSLATSLRIAPTYADAHAYLGRLQLEAGRARQGIAHLELAIELEPRNIWSLVEVARYRALHGDLDGFEEEMRRFHQSNGRDVDVASAVLELRVGSWYRDRERILQAHLLLSESASERYIHTAFARMLVHDELAEEDLRETLERVLTWAHNPRFVSMVCQLAAEAALHHGHEGLAFECLQRAAETVLIDLDWLDYCPLLEPLRKRLTFEGLRALVRGRAEAIWSTPIDD